MRTYYIKYRNIDSESDNYDIWETTEDYTKERCVYSKSHNFLSRRNGSWQDMPEYEYQYYEYTVLTMAEVFLECI